MLKIGNLWIVVQMCFIVLWLCIMQTSMAFLEIINVMKLFSYDNLLCLFASVHVIYLLKPDTRLGHYANRADPVQTPPDQDLNCLLTEFSVENAVKMKTSTINP